MGTAIVTGAARGIGAAIADALAGVGHDLVLVDRCDDDPRVDYALAARFELDAVAARTSSLVVVGDIADSATARAAVDAAHDTYGGVDFAIAAAGVLAGDGPVWELSDAAWHAMVDTNLTGTLQLARAALPVMLQRPEPRRGRFIALSSSIALKATPRLAGYAATKAGVLSLVRSMAADLGGTGITANVIQPGATDTALLERSAAVYDLDDPADFAIHHIDQHLLDPADIAGVVAWLCTPAADAINGAAIPVDAGMTAR